MDEQLRIAAKALAEARAQAEVANAQRGALAARLAGSTADDSSGITAADQGLSAPPVEPAAEEPRDEPAIPLPPLLATEHRLQPSEHEVAARMYFAREYSALPPAPGAPLIDPVALPAARDLRNLLVAEHSGDPQLPTVDVIVCVQNPPPQDLLVCLWSVLHKTDRPLRLVLVNDGSDDGTTEYLRLLVELEPSIKLVENLEEPHGYTIAANLGLRAATRRLRRRCSTATRSSPRAGSSGSIACGESDERIGIVGPLSNAASHQSVPELREDGAWATNPLPGLADGRRDGRRRSRGASRARAPRVPFINGYCYVDQARRALDAVGYFDEENFAARLLRGERLQLRARAGRLRLARRRRRVTSSTPSRGRTRPRDATRSPSATTRASSRSTGARRSQPLVDELESGRRSSSRSARRLARRSRPIRRRWPTRSTGAVAATRSSRSSCSRVSAHGGSGGSHSIYQEVSGMRALGVPRADRDPREALGTGRAAAYRRRRGRLRAFADERELPSAPADANVIVATHSESVAMRRRPARRGATIPARLLRPGLRAVLHRRATRRTSSEACDSYAAIPECAAVRQDALALQHRRRAPRRPRRQGRAEHRRAPRSGRRRSAGRSARSRRRDGPAANAASAADARRSRVLEALRDASASRIEVGHFRLLARATCEARPDRSRCSPTTMRHAHPCGGRRTCSIAPTCSSTSRSTRRSAARRSRRWRAAAWRSSRGSAASGSSSRTG